MKKINVNNLADYIQKRVTLDLKMNNVDAVSIVVNQDGKTVYKNCFGTAKEDSIYRLASMTKPITAVAIMTLFDKGLLDIEDEVSKFLPAFSTLYLADIDKDNNVAKKSPVKTKVTIKHLLTHSSGILNGKSGAIYENQMTAQQVGSLKNAVDFYSNCAVEFEPFTRQEYNPTAAFDILARIVEVVSGESIENYLKENVFVPLNMKDTTFVPSEVQWKKMIQMHNKVDGKSVAGVSFDGCVFENIPISHALGGAGLISTIEDYSAFAEMLLNGGALFDRRILSSKAVDLISTPHISENIMPGYERWGLGVRVIVGKGILPIGSYGWSGAYGTHFWVDKENKLTAIYMKNSRFDGGAGALTAYNFEKDVMCSLQFNDFAI